MDLPLDDRLQLGVQTIHRRTEPAGRRWLPSIDEMRTLVELVDRSGYDSMWVGDHISFHIAIFDPLLQLAQAAVFSRRLVFGTAVYLVPLRHPTPVAKQVSTLDHLTEAVSSSGSVVGGEFQGVRGLRCAGRRARRPAERKHRAHAQAVERQARDPRRPLLQVRRRDMQPPPRQAGGPPICAAAARMQRCAVSDA